MRDRATWPCAILALAAVPAAPAADGPYVDVSASGIWQSNVTNATAGDGVLGAFAATASVGLEADGTAFDDSARSNADAAVVARYTQRFSEALQLAVDGRACAYGANHEVYSGSYASLGATLNWDVSDTWRVKATGGWRDGDIVAEYLAV